MVPSQSQVQAPVRSLDQRMEALKRANDIRVKRAQLKKDLKSGVVSIEQILREPPDRRRVTEQLVRIQIDAAVEAVAVVEVAVPHQHFELFQLSQRLLAQFILTIHC